MTADSMAQVMKMDFHKTRKGGSSLSGKARRRRFFRFPPPVASAIPLSDYSNGP